MSEVEKCLVLEKTSRRRFLAGAAALSAAVPGLVPAQQRRRASVFAYVGSYSLPQGPDGSVGRGEGIHVFEMDTDTGALKQREVIRRDTNPSFMAFDAAR